MSFLKKNQRKESLKMNKEIKEKIRMAKIDEAYNRKLMEYYQEQIKILEAYEE